jgi:excisionase family DNA binding protein
MQGDNVEKLLKVSVVAERLALSRAKTYELLASGVLPSVTVGRSRRVRESDVDVLIQRMASRSAASGWSGG